MRSTAGRRFSAGILATGLMSLIPAASADGPQIVTTIQPIHSLVAGVTDGVTEPRQLIRGGQSPHGYSLTTSDARALHGADAIFAAGESVEGFLTRAARSLDEDNRIVWLDEMEGVVLLEAREGGAWEAHDHNHEKHEDGHGHDSDDGHGEHGHAEDHERHENGHGHDEHRENGHGHAEDHGHDHSGIDGHLWLDPHNAIVLTEQAAAHLAAIDPDNAQQYRTNADAQVGRLEALIDELDEGLVAARERPYLVFHDAYQYFEQRFDLAAAGSVTIDPERPPGARRIRELQQRVGAGDIACVFAEPQFEPRVIEVITEATDIPVGELDPLGARIEPGPDAYFTLLRNLATDLDACLAR